MANGTNVFYSDVAVFLEGIQVPCNSVSVSYGVGSQPTCTIIMPASSIIRDLPESTKVHIFFKDLVLDPVTNDYEWRLLFDGEFSGWQYTTTGEGAYMSLSAIHSTAYLSLMQLVNLDVSNYITNNSATISGDATLPLLLGSGKTEIKVIEKILNKGGYSTMAQIVVELLNEIIETVGSTATGQFYKAKLGVVPKGWKILKRIYNSGLSLPRAGTASRTESIPFTGKYMWPTESKSVTSPYGVRTHPTTGEEKFHQGIDIAADVGDSIFASETGKVTTSMYEPGFGEYIVIQHQNGEQTLYAHLSERLVDFGQIVSKGAKIALAGSTGTSTGPHLHFGLYDKNDVHANPMSVLPNVEG